MFKIKVNPNGNTADKKIIDESINSIKVFFYKVRILLKGTKSSFVNCIHGK